MLKELINSLYDSKSLFPSLDEEGFTRLIEQIEHYNLSAQIYYLLKEKGHLEKTPLFFQEKLKRGYKETLFQNLFIRNQLYQLLNVIEDKGIEVIPLKGVMFAESYFGHIGARATSDIDILVKKDKVYDTIRAVKQLGFLQEGEGIPNHFHLSFSKHIPGSKYPLTVEIHWDLVRTISSKFNVEDIWSEAVPFQNYKMVKTLSHLHTFYMICLHSWRHNLDSPKHYLDVIQLIYVMKEAIDYEKLFRQAIRHGTYKRIVRTISIVYQEFPYLNKVLQLLIHTERKYPTIFDRKDTSKSEIYKDYISYQFFSYENWKDSLVEFYYWMIPSKWDLSKELKITKFKGNYAADLFALFSQRLLRIWKTIFVKT